MSDEVVEPKSYKIAKSENGFWLVYEFEKIGEEVIVQLCHTYNKAIDYMDKIELMNDPENF